MCSKEELFAFLEECPVRKVEVSPPEAVPSGKSFQTKVTFFFAKEDTGEGGECYQIVMRTKKAEDVKISGSARCLRGMIDFDIRQERVVSEGKHMEKFFIILTCPNDDRDCLDITTHMRGTNSVAYTCLPDASTVSPTVEKPEWKGKIQSTARYFPRGQRQAKPKKNIRKLGVRMPKEKKATLRLVK
jgi:hypothetical protein